MHRLALTLLLTSACADGGDEGFHIVHNLAPPSDCTYSPGGPFMSSGLMDVNSPQPYVFTPEIESRITVVDNQNIAQRTIVLRGARIEVQNAQTGATLGKLTSLFSASLTPGGKVAVAFDIITPEMAAMAGASGDTRVQLVAKITAYGALGGSDEIDSVPFQYPVTVCDGCILDIAGTCPLPFGSTVIDTRTCHEFQDGRVTCCTDNGELVCPAVLSPPPAAR